MPTARPRHQVTETPDVARALDAAARRWPDETRSKLLLRLVQVGGDTLQGKENAASHSRRQAVDASSGKYSKAFDADYLADLRRDWPK